MKMLISAKQLLPTVSLVLLGWMLTVVGCTDPIEPGFFDANENAQGLRPVYYSGELREIRMLPARPFDRLGKIYYKNGYLYINELGQGVHVIDNRDPANPLPLRFIQIPGNKDMAIKGTYMYADNFTDLVTLDISQPDTVWVTDRKVDFYPASAIDSRPPVDYRGFFECYDPKKGFALLWEEAQLENPQCYQ